MMLYTIQSAIHRGILLTDVKIQELLEAPAANEAGGSLEKVDNLVKSYGAGIYNIGENIFLYISAIGLLISAALMVIYGSNVNKRADERSGFGWKVAGVILGFATVSIVILASTIGTGAFQ